MRLLPSEVKALAALLEEPAESAEDMAKGILAKLEELRADKQTWALAVQNGPGAVVITGPYSTANQARKAAEKGVGAFVDGAQGMVLPITNPDRWEHPVLAPALCPNCGHPGLAHGFKWHQTCVVKHCECTERMK